MKQIKLNIELISKIMFIVAIAIAIIIKFINERNNPVSINTEIMASNDDLKETVETVEEPVVPTEEELLDTYLNNNMTTTTFLANTFDINIDTLTNLLKTNYKELDLLNQSNYPLFLSEYLLSLEETNKEMFNKNIIPCIDNKDYILGLIKYFTNIYPEVDFSIAAAIAEVESGYTADVMLYRNNIFGGMSSNGLIRYRNIEYGVLSYIKLLQEGYFSKGLITVEDIGLYYNPIDNNGARIANPTWVTNVNNAINNYINYNDIDINVLNSLKMS